MTPALHASDADGVARTEELRELVLAQHQQLQVLHREVSDLNLLMDALKTLLANGDNIEPFTSVFHVLEPLFRFSHVLVLVEEPDDPQRLRCLVASMPGLGGSLWSRSAMADKVLTRDRVIATVGEGGETEWPEVARAAGLGPDQPALYMPVGFRDQRGLLMLLRRAGAAGFDRRDVTVARRLALLASQAFATRYANRVDQERRRLRDLTEELRQARDSLEHRANHDELTGLVSRSYFEAKTSATISGARPGRKLALAFIDLDGFKQVNDYYGHDVGDQLLVAVASRLRRQIRQSDVLARISGDEFMMLIDPADDEDLLASLINRTLESLREPFALGPRVLMVSASIGVALYPEHGVNYEQLRRNADMAMYSAKSSARGTAATYRDSVGVAATERLDREQDLRRAIAERRFRAVVQPEVSLNRQCIVGFEVLARQVDESGALGSSAGFVELAGQLGLLDQITDIVLDDAIAALPLLDGAFGGDLTISINVSTKQFTEPSSLAALLDRLRRSGHEHRFVIEVTEDALLEDAVDHELLVPMLQQAKVRVSIDDFGTGYASLARLLTVTADEIKIDRSFITAVHGHQRSQVLLRAIDYLGEQLGSTVVAEGVETADELDYLLEHTKVHTAQGYLFAHPATPEDVCRNRDGLVGHLAEIFGGPAAGSERVARAIAPADR